MLNLGGLGHSAVIHSTNKEVQKQFGLRMKACLIVNAPSSQGGIGIYITDLFHHLHLVVVLTEKFSFPKCNSDSFIKYKRLANRKRICSGSNCHQKFILKTCYSVFSKYA